MTRLLPLLIAASCLAAASAPRPNPHAACAPARASEASGRLTSKLRHIPDENDPCADSRGAGPLPARAASR